MIVKSLWLFQNYRYMFLKKDMILQSQIEKKRWSSGFSGNDYEYVSPIELNDHYQLFEEYDHRCLLL